jgi:phage tail-like protein
VRKLPGINKFSNIVLKRGMTANRELWEWRKTIIQGQIDRRNGAIIILSDDRQEVARITFFAGWPSKWEGPHLNAKSSEIAIETLEITHEGLDLP